MLKLSTLFLTVWALAPMIEDPLQYFEKVYSNLPEVLGELYRNQRLNLADIALQKALEAYHQRESSIIWS